MPDRSDDPNKLNVQFRIPKECEVCFSRIFRLYEYNPPRARCWFCKEEIRLIFT